MNTRHRRPYTVAATFALTLALLGGTPEAEIFKGPAYLLIQGGGLEEPVTIHHGPQVEGWNTADSPLMRLLMSFTSAREPAPEPETSRYYEVYEFWALPGVPMPRADGLPDGPLDPGLAVSVSRIYPDEPGGPVWNRSNMVPDFNSPGARSTEPYRRITGTGIGVLQNAGLSFGG
jgi:hypothetical protein